MSNIYFPDEEITFNDLYFVCYMIERVARSIKQRNRYVVEQTGTGLPEVFRASLEGFVASDGFE